MTDKEQIIIHRIDVSKCKFYRPGSFPTDCEINPVNAYCESPTSSNCYFKQLARKAEECEELKRKVELMMDCADCKVDKYKQALEEIKKIVEPFCNACQEFEPEKKGSNCMYCNYGKLLQKISEAEK